MFLFFVVVLCDAATEKDFAVKVLFLKSHTLTHTPQESNATGMDQKGTVSIHAFPETY